MSATRASISAISLHAFDDENVSISHLLKVLKPIESLDAAIMAKATAWAKNVRAGGVGHGIEAFLHTYGLDTREGIALMCLAEALLRIPDAETANRLIYDTFEGKEWRDPIQGNESWIISASSWGLLLTGKVVDFGHDAASGITRVLRGLTAKMGDPIIRQALKQAMRLIGAQFVLGETIAEGLEHAKPWARKGVRFSYDMLGEGARTDAQAQAYVQSYHAAIALIGASTKDMPLFAAPSISVKLSALHARYSLSQHERVFSELLPRLKTILLLAKQHNMTVSIDAEEANRLDMELMVFAEILADPDLAGWNGIGFVLQAYQKRAFHVVDFLHALAKKHQRIIPLRLVKGAYWDSEIKHAQICGLPNYPVFTYKEHTDVSYLACAHKILQHADVFYPQFATHNARTIASIQEIAARDGIANHAYEFQRLHGMGEALHAQVLETHASRIYAPIGAHKDLLAYLIRRLLENGANTSFVHLLMDPDVPMEVVLADPISQAKQQKKNALPLPMALYGDRQNSRGFDLGYLPMREQVEQALQQSAHGMNTHEALLQTTPETLGKNIGSAANAYHAWAAAAIETRCHIIEKIADRFDKNANQFIALLVHEAGKTVPDAISEVREAIDFCRYYALHARKLMAAPVTLAGPTGELNQLSLHPRGVFACISPWNFPLAIFAGQVVAALVTGNAVIAKPAEQTPDIALLAVRLMHEAGIPNGVLQLAIGKGSVIGSALTGDPRIAGVVFTGSGEVATSINRSLANRAGAIVPFIAETGGQNCMVVDSSALLEQAADDIIVSAFGSAGQRCSALRVLYVQDDIADDLLVLLSGAMAELNVGNPAEISTDVGPVIDEAAQQTLLAHIAHMKATAKYIASAPESRGLGHFVTPHMFEIGSIAALGNEVFGPILHIIRFPANAMARVADEINATGFGLTFGIHSRIEANIQLFLNRVRAGNRYVNRSMIGAVVGVQPFGGEGLSGTGPKAGGPFYLMKFLHERTASINVAAIGGNAELLAGKIGDS